MNPRIGYWPSGNIRYEIWSIAAKYHRLDGPALQEWYENGNIKFESWLQNDIYHRFNGPAIQWWYINGNKNKNRERWYYNGIKYEKEDHPFNQFCKEHNLSETYDKWPIEMRVLFEVTYK